MIEKTIKPQGIESGNMSCSIGYVAVPDGEDRDKYVEDCYRTNRITMYGGMHYGYFHNVSVDIDSIQRIKFPKDNKSFGSPVLWVNIPIWNKPAIIAVFNYEDDYFALEEECRNTSLERNGRQIDISKRADDATIDIHIRGDSNVPGHLNLNIINDNKTCELNVYVTGKTTLSSTEQLTLRSDKKLELIVVDKNSKKKLDLTYEDGNGLHYKDEFENEVTMDEDGIKIVTHNNIDIVSGENTVSMDDSGINIDAGGNPIFVGGDKEVLFSKIPGANEIVDLTQIGVSKIVKVG